MSEPLLDPPDSAGDAAPATGPTPPDPLVSPPVPDQGMPLPVPLSPVAVVSAATAGLPESHAILSTIERGLAPTADDAARATARDLWSRLSLVLSGAVAQRPGATRELAPMLPTGGPVPPPFPAMPSSAGASPLGQMVQALRQVPPDQLLDLVLARLRAALPTGATAPTPRGIQFPPVPLPPGGGTPTPR